MRRGMFAAAMAAAAVLVSGGCSTAETGARSDGGGTRTVTHEVGQAVVPEAPARVIAFDEGAAIAALTAGVRPSVVYLASGDVGAAAILAAEGIETRQVAAVSLPSFEEIVAFQPDLLVGTGALGPVGTEFGRLSEIAPTLVLPITGSWRELVTEVGRQFGTEERAQRQIALIEQRLAAAKVGAEGRTLSLLGNTFGATNFTMPPAAPSSTLIADAGFVRPPFQQQPVEGYSVVLSAELLPQQNAELIVVPIGVYYSPDALFDEPTAVALTGTRISPLGEAWLTATPFSFFVTATDLEAIAAGKPVTTEGEMTARWQGFVAESGRA